VKNSDSEEDRSFMKGQRQKVYGRELNEKWYNEVWKKLGLAL
jgi:hypothetical protein